MALPSEKATALRESLSRALLDQLTEALLSYHSVDQLSAPVLRFEAFIEDGPNNGENATTDDNPWSRQPIVSVSEASTRKKLLLLTASPSGQWISRIFFRGQLVPATLWHIPPSLSHRLRLENQYLRNQEEQFASRVQVVL